MYRLKYPTEQSDPPLSPRETLPTMYDLPSENPEEPGVDHFHNFQSELLLLTFCPPNYSGDRVFSASDLNLYYDVHHQNWYKRPDWFGVVGVPKLYDGKELRLSYVIWQEGVSPTIAVELLSPSTEKEDLGAGRHFPNIPSDKPPSKWEVYEQILRIPYYVVFSRYTDQMRVFHLQGGHYGEITLTESKVWIEELSLGLGLWQGEYKANDRLWLRWYDAENNWIPTDSERAKSAEQRAISAEQRAAELAQRLRDLGIEP